MMILSRLFLSVGLLAGLVSVAYAVPVDHTTNASGSHSHTPAENPHPPASPGRSQMTTTTSSTAEKPKVTVFFMYDSEYGGTGTASRSTGKEVKAILKEWRKHKHLTNDFDVTYTTRYDYAPNWNHHHFYFWGPGAGEECVEVDVCSVQFVGDEAPHPITPPVVPLHSRIAHHEDNPESIMAVVYRNERREELLEVPYRIRHDVEDGVYR